MPPVIGMSSARHASPMPSTASTNCHMISGRSGLPKFRQLVAPIGTRAGAGDVARRLGDGQHRAAARIEIAVAAVAVDRHRQRAIGALDAHDARAQPGSVDRVGAHHVVVLPVDPALARDRRRREQRAAARRCGATASAQRRRDRARCTSSRYAGRVDRPVVDRRFVGQRAVRNLGDDRRRDPSRAACPSSVTSPMCDGVQVPLLEDRARPRPRGPS